MHCYRILKRLVFFPDLGHSGSVRIEIDIAVIAIGLIKIGVHNVPFQSFIERILITVCKNDNSQFLLRDERNAGNKAVHSTGMFNNLSSTILLQKPTKTI